MAPAKENKEMAQFIQESDSLLTDLTSENEKLAAENAQLRLQKTAADTSTQAVPVLEKEAVTKTVDSLIEAGFEQSANREALVCRIMESPETTLHCLDKIAGQRKPHAGTIPSLGKVAGADSSEVNGARDSDRVFEERFPVTS
jgi:hypothetical protein